MPHKTIAKSKPKAIGLRNTTMTPIGYARVSSDSQNTETQMATLQAAGALKIFQDQASGGRWERPGLHEMLTQLRPGDVVVVWKLDRLSRSLKDLLHIIEKINQAGAGLRSLTEPVDTTNAAGRMFMQMIGSFAEFERSMIRERTLAGLSAAKDKGRKGGRRPKLTPIQKEQATQMVLSGEKSASDVARLFGVHPSTIGRAASARRP
jgi:DNA invertase Pin-like site-specific DNA recombinase